MKALRGSVEQMVELHAHGRLPRLNIGIDWESPWQEFESSVRSILSGARAPKESELPADSQLRVHWIGGRNSGWAFAASSVWHAIVVTLLILPVWGFLPTTAQNLAPVRIELDMTAPADLPSIHLASSQPAPARKQNAAPAPTARLAKNEAPAPDGADAFHPRQTILSVPVRITHPRQTLIQPATPMAPPKIETELPNIVQWAASAPAPRLQLQLAPSVATPKMRVRAVENAVAPDVANVEKNSGPLNVAASAVVNPAPQMPMMPMAAAVAGARRTRAESGGVAAPEVSAETGDANLRSVIALSASPAPPAPEVAVPEGNLAARVTISPAGTQHGSPGGTGSSESGTAIGNGGTGNGNGSSSAGAGAGGAGTSTVAVSVSGGESHASVSGGGGLAAGQSRSKLILKPVSRLPEKPEPMIPRRAPVNIAGLDPKAPPEAILSGKEVHTLNINLPNLTSVSGSWILNFAQLDDDGSPFNRPKGVLAGPVPIRKVDPKYPPETMKENIEGEVVLYAIIRADGSVDSIQLMRKLDSRLDANSVEALAQWKFRPATRDGAPVDIEAVVHIPFKYRPPER